MNESLFTVKETQRQQKQKQQQPTHNHNDRITTFFHKLGVAQLQEFPLLNPHRVSDAATA